MRWLILLSTLLLLVALAPPTLSIQVSPVVLFEGNAVRVRCRVPLNPQNRRLQIALDDYRYSEVPIDGEHGPVTTEVVYDHVPCEVAEASCTVWGETGAMRRVQTNLTVVCRG